MVTVDRMSVWKALLTASNLAGISYFIMIRHKASLPNEPKAFVVYEDDVRFHKLNFSLHSHP